MNLKAIVDSGVKYLTVLSLLIQLSTLASAQPILRFAAVEEIPEQVVVHKILTAAYSKIGISVQFVPMPAKRALKESSTGKLDGEAFRIKELAEFYPTLQRMPTPVYYMESSVFTKNKNNKITDCASIKNLTVGIIRGIKKAELCTKDLKNVQIFSSPSTMMKMLNTNKIDLAILSKNSGIAILKQFGFESITALHLPLNRVPVYHYLHEKNIDIIPKIEATLSQMKASGELEDIRKKALVDLFTKYEIKIQQEL
jgi:ABC-type amino acid transport substrate-binding protein